MTTAQGYPYIIQGSNIVVVIDNVPHTVSKTHITYNAVLDAIKKQDWAQVKEVIEPKKIIVSYGRGNVSVQNGELLWKGKIMHGYLASKIVGMLQEGLPIDPLVNFMHNLMSNPSKRAIDELYGFLEKGAMPITPDGYFLAYKKVRANYFDVHSGTMDNSVGKIVEMERGEVDDDKDRTCSAGLHFCSRSYLNHFGGERIVIVKINPRDVVSIPSDYNDAKGRACRYEVIGELDDETRAAPERAFTSTVQSNGNGVKAETAVKPAPVASGWPFVAAAVKSGQQIDKTIPQEYDANGNALSMTKDAIRKRRARAAKASKNELYARGYIDSYLGRANQRLGPVYDSGMIEGGRDQIAGRPMKYKAAKPAAELAKKSTPATQPGPVESSSEYARGYTDGWLGVKRQSGIDGYDSGYDVGSTHRRGSVLQRIRYVPPAATTGWPQPKR